MRDIVVFLFLLCCIGTAIRKPWWGVLSLAVFSYLNPHAYTWGFVRTLPIYYILFLIVLLRTIISKDRQRIPQDWRIKGFILLWMYFIFTTTQAYVPDAAWQKLLFVTKIYVPFYFTWVLINTREKLYYLIITIASSIGIVGFKGGMFALLTGFSHRVYGPPSTQFEENNAFAIACLMTIPLVLLWHKESENQTIKRITLYTIPFLYISANSSWSRGALITMVILTFILIINSQQKYLSIPFVLIGIFLLKDHLPAEWTGRMQTIETYDQDSSAMSRIETWKDGWNHAVSHPFTGSGFDGWIYVSMRDWHSSYVEMLAEHGFIAFGLWISLIIGTLFSLTKLPQQFKNIESMRWVNNYCFAIKTSLICYMVGTAFLGLSYWDLLYHLIFIAVLIKKFAYEEFNNLSSGNRIQ